MPRISREEKGSGHVGSIKIQPQADEDALSSLRAMPDQPVLLGAPETGPKRLPETLAHHRS